jgi:hypothetical protein
VAFGQASHDVSGQRRGEVEMSQALFLSINQVCGR